jgi:predicted Holliday junction resolvase-like endonuclease
MSSDLAMAFGDLGQILAVCPCCQDIFYVSESRPYLVGKRPKSVVDRLRAASQKLDREEEALNLIEYELRERAAMAGRLTAKKLLRKIDPVFSGAGYDPQDVKVIFNPVTYIVFQGLATNDLRKVTLLAHQAQDTTTERVHKSIERTIERGNFEFRVLRVDDQGQVFSE